MVFALIEVLSQQKLYTIFKYMKYEFTDEEVKMLWDMVDVCLKVGGLSNLDSCQKIIRSLQRPIKDSNPPSVDDPRKDC
jgi:hypothetical protein